MSTYRLHLVFEASSVEREPFSKHTIVDADTVDAAIETARARVDETIGQPLYSAFLESPDGHVVWRLMSPQAVADLGKPDRRPVV